VKVICEKIETTLEICLRSKTHVFFLPRGAQNHVVKKIVHTISTGKVGLSAIIRVCVSLVVEI
jgi:hypothetical protein